MVFYAASLFCNKDVFNHAQPSYENALADSGFHSDLNYNEEQPQEVDGGPKESKKIKTIWSNPTYSSNVKPKSGASF